MTQIQVIFGKGKITKGITLPIYTEYDMGISWIVTRFSLQGGKLVEDRIVVKYDEHGDIEHMKVGQSTYSKIASTEDIWDMSGWSEYSFQSNVVGEDRWKRMRKLLKKAYKATK